MIFRKICFGTRSESGLKTHSILPSLVQTARRQGVHPREFLQILLTADTATAQAPCITIQADVSRPASKMGTKLLQVQVTMMFLFPWFDCAERRPEGASVSSAWFSPQRSGGENQGTTAQRPDLPRERSEGGTPFQGDDQQAKRRWLTVPWKRGLATILGETARPLGGYFSILLWIPSGMCGHSLVEKASKLFLHLA